MNAIGAGAMSLVTSLATAIVIVALAILPFLSPQWMAFEQGRANATGWTGFTTEQLNGVTGSILSDLVFGPAAFDVQVDGRPVLDERERGHMRDVRTAFMGLWIAAAASLVVLLVASRRPDRRRTWRAIRRGAAGLAVAVVALGAVALVAFDALFEAFHRVLFPAGSYDFDPATERLVQLFPFQFWQESAIVVGIVILALCALVAAFAGPRAIPTPRDEATGEVAIVSGARP